MEIGPLAANGSLAAAHPAIASPLLRGALGVISQGLGMEQPQVESALARGTSLDELAARQGVSSPDLQSAAQSHIAAARQAAGQAAIEPETLQRMVARAFAQGRRSADPQGPSLSQRREPLAVYGSAGRVVGEAAPAGISILA